MPNQKDAFTDLGDILDDDDNCEDDSSGEVEGVDGDTITLGMDEDMEDEDDD